MLSLAKMEQQTVFIPESDAQEVETDLVIVGGGPAGDVAEGYKQLVTADGQGPEAALTIFEDRINPYCKAS